MSFSSGGAHEVLRADYVLSFKDHGLSTATHLDRQLRSSLEATGRVANQTGRAAEAMSGKQAAAWKRAAAVANESQRKIADGQIQTQRRIDHSITSTVSRMRKMNMSYDQIAATMRRYRADAVQTAAAIEHSSKKELASIERVAAARGKLRRMVGLGPKGGGGGLGASAEERSLERGVLGAASSRARLGAGSLGGGLIGGLIGYAGISGMKDAINTTTTLARETQTLTHITGMSNQEAASWLAITKARDISTRTFGMSLKTLGTQMSGALQKPTESNTRAFRNLGITQAEVKAHAHDLSGMLGVVADHLNKMPPGAEKTAAASKLLGRNWMALQPMLLEGSKGMAVQRREAAALGVTLGGNAAQNAKKMEEAQINLKIASMALQVQFAEHLAPTLIKIIDWMIKAAGAVRKEVGPAFHWIGRTIRDVSHWFHEHQLVLKAVEVGAIALGGAFVGLKVISTVVRLVRGLTSDFRTVFTVVKSFVTGPLGALKGLFFETKTAEEQLMFSQAKLAESNARTAASFEELSLMARQSAESMALANAESGGGLPMAGIGGKGGALTREAQVAERTAMSGGAVDLAAVRQFGLAPAGGASLASRAGGVAGGLAKGGLVGGLIFMGGGMATDLATGLAGGKGTTLGGDLHAFGHGAAIGGGIGAAAGSVIPGVRTLVGGAAGAGVGAALGGGLHLIGKGGGSTVAGAALTGAAIGSFLPFIGTGVGAGVGAILGATGLVGPSDQQARGQKLLKDTQEKINGANADTLSHLQTRLDASRKEGGLTRQQAGAAQSVLNQRSLQLQAPGIRRLRVGISGGAAYAPREQDVLAQVLRTAGLAGPTRTSVFGPGPGLRLATPRPSLTPGQTQGVTAQLSLVAQAERQGKLVRGTTDRLINDLEKKFGPSFARSLYVAGASSMRALDAGIKQSNVIRSTQGLINDMNRKWPLLIPATKVGMKNYQQEIVNDLNALRGRVRTAHGQEKQDLIDHINSLKKVYKQGLDAQLQALQANQDDLVKQESKTGKNLTGQAQQTWKKYRDSIRAAVGAGVIDQRTAHKLMEQNNAALAKVQATQLAGIAGNAAMNWGKYKHTVASAASDSARANKRGVDAIQAAADQILKSLGAQGVPAVKVTGLDAIAGAAQDAGTGAGAGASAGQRRTATGGRVPGPVGMDTWMLVDPGGKAAAMVGGGEILVANRHTEARVDDMLAPYGTSLGMEVQRETVPHYAATGARVRRLAKGGTAAASGLGASGDAASGAVQYVFPFPKGEAFSWQRIDQGQDLQGPPGGPVLAIGPGNVSTQSDSFSGFGANYPILSLSAGPWAGQSVYYGHAWDTRTGGVNPGDVIGKTQTSASQWTAAPAGWLEFGFTSALGHGIQGQGAEVAPMLHALASGHMVAGAGGVGGISVPTLKAPGVAGKGAGARAVRASLKKATDAANKKIQAAAAARGATGTTGGNLTVLPGPAPPGALQWEVKAVQETDDLAGNSGGGAYGPLIGYSELGNPLGSGVGNALGHLPGMTMMYISANKKTIEAPLVDIGTGSQGGEWTSFPSLVMGLYPKASQALGFAPDSSPWLVDIGRVDRQTIHPASGIPIDTAGARPHAFGGRVPRKAGKRGRNRQAKHLPFTHSSYHLPERARGGRVGFQTGGLFQKGMTTSGGWTYPGGATSGSGRGKKPPGTSWHWDPFSNQYEAMTSAQYRSLTSAWYAANPGTHIPSGPTKGKKPAAQSYHWDPGKNQYVLMTAADYKKIVDDWYKKHPKQHIPTGPAKVKTSKAAAQSLLDQVTADNATSAFGLGYQHGLDPAQGMTWKDAVAAAIVGATASSSGGYVSLFPDHIIPINPIPDRVGRLLQGVDRFVTGHERHKESPGKAISRALLYAGMPGIHKEENAPFFHHYGRGDKGKWVSVYSGRSPHAKNAFLGVKGHGYAVPAAMHSGHPGWFREKPHGSWDVRHPRGYATGGRLVYKGRGAGHPSAGKGHGHGAGKSGGKKGKGPGVTTPSDRVQASIGPTVPGYDYATDQALGYQVLRDPTDIYGDVSASIPGIAESVLASTSIGGTAGLLGGENDFLAGLIHGTPYEGIHRTGMERAGGEIPILTDPLKDYGDEAAQRYVAQGYAGAARGDISKVLHSHALRRVNNAHHRHRARHEAAQLGRIRGQLSDPSAMTARQLDTAHKELATDLKQLQHVPHPGKNVKGAIKNIRDALTKVDFSKGIRDSAKTIDSETKRIAQGGTPKQMTAAFTALAKTLDDTQHTSFDRLVKLHDALKKQLSKMDPKSKEAKRLGNELALVDVEMGKRTGTLVKAAEDQAAGIAKAQTRLQRLMTRRNIDAASGRGAEMLAQFSDQAVAVMQNTVKSLQKALSLAKRAGDQAAVDDISTKLNDALDQLDQAVTDDVDAHRKAIEAAAQDAVDSAQHAQNLQAAGEQALQIKQGLAGTTGTIGAATEMANYIRGTIVPGLQKEVSALQTQQQAALSVGDQKLADQIGEAIAAKTNDVSQAQLDALNAIKDATQATAQNIAELGGQLGVSYQSQNLPDFAGMLNGA